MADGVVAIDAVHRPAVPSLNALSVASAAPVLLHLPVRRPSPSRRESSGAPSSVGDVFDARGGIGVPVDRAARRRQRGPRASGARSWSRCSLRRRRIANHAQAIADDGPGWWQPPQVWACAPRHLGAGRNGSEPSWSRRARAAACRRASRGRIPRRLLRRGSRRTRCARAAPPARP